MSDCVYDMCAVGQRLSAGSRTSTPHSTEATPPATPPVSMADITASSTPGLIPAPPPTPAIGPGGVPLPPPPPPSSLSSQPHLKRVNWQKMATTDGTVWGEVSLIPILPYSHSPIPTQLSGLDEAIELAELDSQFALRKSKGQLADSTPHPPILPSSLPPSLPHSQSLQEHSRARDRQCLTPERPTISVSYIPLTTHSPSDTPSLLPPSLPPPPPPPHQPSCWAT